MDQYKVNVHGASPIHDDDDPPVGALTIFEPIPEQSDRTEDELKDIYAHDAEQILTVLVNCLPQGTLDQLLIQLLTDKASLLRVRAPQRRWIQQ